MADIQEAIRRLTYIFTSQGADQVKSDMKSVGDATDAIGVTSDKTSKSSLSLEQSFANLERRFVTTVAQQQNFQKVQSQVNLAVAQNPALQDRANAVLDAAAIKYNQAGAAQKLFAAATSGVSGQLIALSAGAGPIGVFLAALGPWGLAAGVGLGLAEKALSAMGEQATRMGELAISLRTLADVTSLSTDQIQVLQHAGASVGLTTDQVSTSFERFSVSLGQLKNGTGALYTELQKVSPVLVTQLASTKDSATAWNLLAQAYGQADAQQQKLITHAAFGRGGAVTGALLTQTNQSGGINNLLAPGSAADLITPQQVALWAQLKTQIDQATGDAQNNIASIFTTDVLQKEKFFADAFLDISRAAKDISSSSFGAILTNAFTAAIPGVNALLALYRLIPSGGGSFANRFSFQGATAGNAVPITGSPLAGAIPPTDKDGGGTSAAFQAAQAKAQVAALGSAASAYEQLHAKVLQLNADLAAGTINQQTYNRAVAGAGLETAIQLESRRIGLLGQMAPVDETVKQKQLEINAARMQGVTISAQEAGGILALTRAQAEYSKLSAQATLGVLDPTRAAAQAQKDLAANVAAGIVPADQQGAALVALTKKYKDLSDASKVAGSNFPQLTQFTLDAGNLNKQLDTLAVSGLNDVTNALVAIGTHSMATGDAFRNLGLQVITAIEQMIIKMTIMQPIAALLQSTLAGAGGGFNFLSIFGGGGNAAFGAGPGNFADTTAANGKVFDKSGLYPFAGGGIVTSPTVFPFAGGVGLMGEAGPEAIMPLKRGSDGKLGVSGGNGAGSGVQINMGDIHIDASGADPAVVARLQTTLNTFRKNQYADVVKIVTDASNRGMRLHS